MKSGKTRSTLALFLVLSLVLMTSAGCASIIGANVGRTIDEQRETYQTIQLADIHTLSEGERIRVLDRNDHDAYGFYAGVKGDTWLVLRPEGSNPGSRERIEIELVQIELLQRVERRSHAGKAGVFVGAVIDIALIAWLAALLTIQGPA